MTTATRAHVHPFDASGDGMPADIDALGGKGLSLARMARAGFPVPPGFTIATSAYRQFVADIGLQEAIVELTRPQMVGGVSSFAAASERISAMFAETPLSNELKDEVGAAYAAFGAGAPSVAVRSSANAEDLPDLSFAGQHDTLLNVRGVDAVVTAVRRCWASLWTERAMGYRHENGIEQQSVAMGVVVQRMVEADVSGVLFTANPRTGDRSEMIVNASFGLGEAIVGGEVTPDTFVIDRDTLTTKETTVGAKELTVVSVDGQGTRTRESSSAERQQLSLAAPALTELARLATEVEQHFEGVPQDIEWAIAGPELSLLQSRPMTNLPPPPLKDVKWEVTEPGSRLERDQVVEFMPGPLSPLFQDLYLPALDVAYYLMRVSQGGNEASGATYRQLAKVLGGQHGGQSVVNGYAYRHFPPPGNPFVLRPRGGRAGRNRFNVRDVSRGYHETPRRWRHEELPKYLKTVELWRQLDPAAAEDERLLAGIRTLCWADAHYWRFVDEVLAFPRRADEALQEFLAEHAPGANLTSGMLLDGSGSPTMQAPIALWRIAQRIRSEAALRELVVTTPAHRLLTLDAFADGRAVVGEIARYLGEYGHQIYSLDFAEPTPSQDPTQVLTLLKSLVLDDDYDPAAQQAETRATRRRALRDASRHFRGRLWWRFRWRLFWAQHYYPNRDESQFYLGAAWPVLQRLALELGQRLVAVGTLARPDDVYYLDGSELDRAIEARRDERAAPDLRHQAVERRELREARKRLSPPPTIPPRTPPANHTEDAPNIMKGVPVSPGKVTAEISVILSLAEFEQMRPHSILVCPLTTPAWTQLFPHAVGLATDVGGITAHGSIVAREYGIPAVLGLGDITKRLSSGQTITIDGDAGTVTIEDEAVVPTMPTARRAGRSLPAVADTPQFIGLATPLPFEYSTRRRLLGLLARPFKAAFYQVLLFIYFKLTGPSGGPAAPAAGRRQSRNRSQTPRP